MEKYYHNCQGFYWDGMSLSFLLDFGREYHVLPQRLFVPVAGSVVMLCDYKFGDEAAGEIQERFVEMLDQPVQAEDMHIAEDISTGKYLRPGQAGSGARKMLANGTNRFYPDMDMPEVNLLHMQL